VFLGHQPLLAQVRLEVRVAAALPVEVDAVADEAQARDAGRGRADGGLRDLGLWTVKIKNNSKIFQQNNNYYWFKCQNRPTQQTKSVGRFRYKYA